MKMYMSTEESKVSLSVNKLTNSYLIEQDRRAVFLTQLDRFI